MWDAGAQDAEDAPVRAGGGGAQRSLDLADALRDGIVAEALGPKLGEARTQFVEAAREGVALNKWGRRYRRRAVQDLESALRQVPDDLARRRMRDCRRGDLQQLVDDMTRRGLSGSRVRSVVNALRSLYRWAQDRELVVNNPAELVRLPAMDAKPRDRVAAPDEFAALLAPLSSTTPCCTRSPPTRRPAIRRSGRSTGATST